MSLAGLTIEQVLREYSLSWPQAFRGRILTTTHIRRIALPKQNGLLLGRGGGLNLVYSHELTQH